MDTERSLPGWFIAVLEFFGLIGVLFADKVGPDVINWLFVNWPQ